jgi:Bifunctional DNA primase/polymerase, N-terminal
VGWADGSRHPPEVRWLFQHRNHTGIGIATGECSGAWVLDVDGHDGEVSLRNLIREHGTLPHGPITVTHGGFHFWFGWTPACKALRNRIGFARGLDVRTNGGGVAVPPSAHPEGGRYIWRDVSILDMEPPPAPDWLLAEIVGSYQSPTTIPTSSPAAVVTDRYAEGALRSAEDRIATAGDGQQRSTLYTEAFSIGARIVAPGLVSVSEALDRLTAAGLRMANYKRHRWVPDAVQRVVSDGLNAGVGRVFDAA